MGLTNWLIIFWLLNVGFAALVDNIIVTRWSDIRLWLCKHEWHFGETFCNRCGRRM